jgi:ADP-heptose:LPS heptosyltransferase
MDPALSAPSEPRRILIVLMGAIGDVVRALPLAGRIRRGWPNAHIAWAVEPKSAPIVQTHPWIDEVILYDRRRAPWSFLPFLSRVRAAGFDLVIDLQRHLKSGVTAYVSGASRRIGFDSANTKEFNHLFSTERIAPQPNMRLKLMQYQVFGDALGLAPTPIEFALGPTRAEEQRADALLADAPAPRLAVILGSSWPSRIYFPESIAAVISDLARAGASTLAMFPVLLGGPDETELGAEVARLLNGAPGLNLTGKTSLRDLIAIFKRCDAAFGPDSGPMHIAAAVGCPVVSLWGATEAQRSAPWGYERYAISADIPCHPCYLRECPVGRECMRRIVPAQVASTIREIISTTSSSSSSRAVSG